MPGRVTRVSKEDLIRGSDKADKIVKRCEQQSGEDCAQAVLSPDDIRELREFLSLAMRACASLPSREAINRDAERRKRR